MAWTTCSTLVRFLSAVFLLSVAATSLEAEVREFTSSDGKKLTGELIGVSAGVVNLKIGGQATKVPFDRFSKKDQEFIRAWFVKNPSLKLRLSHFKREGRGDDSEPARSGLLGLLRPPPENSDAPSKNKGRTAIPTESPYHFEVHVNNNGPVEITGLEVRYRVYKYMSIYSTGNTEIFGNEVSKQEAKGMIYVDGTTELGPIERGKRAEFKTKSIVLNRAKADHKAITTYTDGSTTTDKASTIQREVLEGVYIQLLHKGRVIDEIKDFSPRLEKMKPVL